MRKARKIKLELEFECPATDLNQDPDTAVKRYLTLKPGAKLLSKTVVDTQIVNHESEPNMGARRYNEYLRVVRLAVKQSGLLGVEVSGGGWARWWKSFLYHVRFSHIPIVLEIRNLEGEAGFKIERNNITDALDLVGKTFNLAHPDSLAQMGEAMKEYSQFPPEKSKCPKCSELWWKHTKRCSKGPYNSLLGY